MAYHNSSNPDQLPAFPEPDTEKHKQRVDSLPSPQHAQPPRFQQSPPPQQQQYHPQQQQQWQNEPRRQEPQYRPQEVRPLDLHGNQNHPGPSLPSDPRSGGYRAPPPRSPAPPRSPVPPRSPAPQHSPVPPTEDDLNNLSDAGVERLFYKLDKKKGYVTVNDLAGSLVNGDREASKFSPVTVRMMVRMFDSNRNGELELHEFVGMWRFLEQWRNIFNEFDKDKSGTISLSEFRVAIVAFQYRLSDAFVEFVFKLYDKRDTGVLTFDIFMQACITLKRMTDIFKKYDDDRDGFITISFEDFVTEFLRQLQRMVTLSDDGSV